MFEKMRQPLPKLVFVILFLCSVPAVFSQPDSNYPFMKTGEVDAPVIYDRIPGFEWGATCLKISTRYEVGLTDTRFGKKVLVYKYLSSKTELISTVDSSVIPEDPSFFAKYGIDPSFNCFGYAFTNGKYVVEQPLEFLQDEYENCRESEAEVAVFVAFQEVTEDGQDYMNPIHIAVILPDGHWSYKPGVRKLVEDVDLSLANDVYNYNRILFYKRKTSR